MIRLLPPPIPRPLPHQGGKGDSKDIEHDTKSPSLIMGEGTGVGLKYRYPPRRGTHSSSAA